MKQVIHIIILILVSSTIFVLALMDNKFPFYDFIVEHDKLGHILAFITLAFLLDTTNLFHKHKTNIILLLCFGMLIEISQYFDATRTFSFKDFFADIIGITFYYFTRMIYIKSHKNKVKEIPIHDMHI
jgi:VanZ family protein